MQFENLDIAFVATLRYQRSERCYADLTESATRKKGEEDLAHEA